MKQLTLILTLLVGLLSQINAQAPATPAAPSKPGLTASVFTGQVGATFDKNNLFFTCGGPNLRLGYQKWGAYIGAFPSLRYRFEEQIPVNAVRVFTMLGAGAGISYKRYSLIYIAFFPAAVNATTPPKTIHSFGIAIKVGK
jgi:hypothetical protein